MKVKKLAYSMGAEISGFDCATDPTLGEWDIIHRAFTDHLAIFFPKQDLTTEQLSSFVEKFGKPLVHPYFVPLQGSSYVHEIRKTPKDEYVFGNVWHTDFTNLPMPSLANALYARQVPLSGGDTLFANMYLAFDSLSTSLQKLLGGLNAIHGFSERYKQTVARQEAKLGATKLDDDTIAYRNSFDSEVLHPVVRVHPESGRRALYVNPNFTLRFEGMSHEESEPILSYLYKHSIRPEFVFRYRWSADTLGVWDNRCTMHYATNDYVGETRIMHRMVVMEGIPTL